MTSPPREHTSRQCSRAGKALSAALMGALLLTACGGDPDDGAAEPTTPTAGTTPPVTLSTSPSPTTGPSRTPQEAAAISAAEAIYREYVRVGDTVTNSGGKDAAEKFSSVAIGQELNESLTLAAGYARNGWHSIGNTNIQGLQVKSVNLHASPPEHYPQVVFTACLDGTDIRVVDSAGNSPKGATNQERYATTAYVENYPEQGGWRVAETRIPGESC